MNDVRLVYVLVHHGSQNIGHGQTDRTIEMVTAEWPYVGDTPLAFATREACDEFVKARGWRVEVIAVQVRE